MSRIAVSRSLRFWIFERDEFTCQYCGRWPPEVVLELEHLIPVSKGGTNDPENLLTACFDCNRGKCARDISHAMSELTEKKAENKRFWDKAAAAIADVELIDCLYEVPPAWEGEF